MLEVARGVDCELQRLHGMGELLYDEARRQVGDLPPVRVYAPVGEHEDLLPYLVRRLLENGANSSFVNRFLDAEVSLNEVVRDPVADVTHFDQAPHPHILRPRALYGAARENSAGVDLDHPGEATGLLAAMEPFRRTRWGDDGDPVTNPANRDDIVGVARSATPAEIDQALEAASAAQPGWDATPAPDRAAILEEAARLYERHRAELAALLVREAGKTVADALAEIREAVDFCRYYAVECRTSFDTGTPLPGPTGERNALRLHGRGVFACIAPWNFPLAIFTGQIAAALAAGNAVAAKPAEQTLLIGARAGALLHEAGIPRDVLQLLPGPGQEVGQALVEDRRVSGVAFTGSTRTAQAIHRTLAARDGPIVPLIAETGGQNAMLVDSTALIEQTVDDIVRSAFLSAGQRCSALRVLYVQDDVADRLLGMLAGAMDVLRIGDPWDLSTDVGPVMDHDARDALEAHAADLAGHCLHACALGSHCAPGTFVAPRILEIDGISDLTEEHFAPPAPRRALPRIRLAPVPRRDPRFGFPTDPRPAKPHRPPRRAGGRTLRRRQPVREPGHGRRRGRNAAVRGRGPERHRTQGRRAALPAAFCRRAGRDGQHRRDGRQRGVAGVASLAVVELALIRGWRLARGFTTGAAYERRHRPSQWHGSRADARSAPDGP